MQLELGRWDEVCRTIYVTFEIEHLNTRKLEITVSQDTNLNTGDLRRPTINWPAIGASDTGVAKQFARALREAARVASAIDKIPLGGEVTNLKAWRRKYGRRKQRTRPVLKVTSGKIEVVL